MTDIEIDKALAFAIGYKAEDIFAYCDCLEVSDSGQLEGREFSHKDWNVIGPIAERYDCFPVKTSTKEWGASINFTAWDRVYADTPQKAVAIAVIQGAKK